MLKQQVAILNSENNLNFDVNKAHKFDKFYCKCAKCGKLFLKSFYSIESYDLTKQHGLCRGCTIKKTILEKYGVDNIAKVKSIQEKIKQTNLKRYGATSPGKNETIKAKQRNTLKERYGNTNPGAQANHLKFINYRNDEVESLGFVWLDRSSFRGKYDENGPIYYTFKCLKCGQIFKDDFHSDIPVCRNCHPLRQGSSKPEDDLYENIASFYKGKIIRHCRNILDNSRKELDMYFPEKNIAIEFNGTYWHGYSVENTETLTEFKKKVEEKRLDCLKKGIRLINIDECDYINRPEVFHRFFQDLLLPRKRVYARNCDFKEIDLKTAKDFLNYYHVNGFRGGSKKYGLFYNDELLCVAIFGKNKKYGWECIRLCYKTGYDIIGGWAKIQKHFGKQFLHYVNLKYFIGENKTGCGYRFVFGKHKVVYRNQLQKEKDLKKYCKKIDRNISSFKNCLNNNGIAVFDNGNDIRIYNEGLL